MMRYMLVLALPIIYLLGWWANLEYSMRNGRIVRLEVQGYDPRDLIAGHYLTFQLKLDKFNPCTESSYSNPPEAYVCFSEPDEQMLSRANAASRQVPTDCNLYLAGQCRYTRFISGLERYYIAERFAPVLSTAPANSQIEVSISKNGTAYLRRFLVNGRSVEEYAESQLRRPETRPLANISG